MTLHTTAGLVNTKKNHVLTQIVQESSQLILLKRSRQT
jgi:hypothetical protein